MTTDTVEQAVPEVTARALLTQHALRVNCAVRAPCKVSSIYSHCSSYYTFVRSFVRTYVRSFVRSSLRSFVRSLLPSFLSSLNPLFVHPLICSFCCFRLCSSMVVVVRLFQMNKMLSYVSNRGLKTLFLLALQGCSRLFQLT